MWTSTPFLLLRGSNADQLSISCDEIEGLISGEEFCEFEELDVVSEGMFGEGSLFSPEAFLSYAEVFGMKDLALAESLVARLESCMGLRCCCC